MAADPKARLLVRLLLLCWAVAFFGAFLAFYLTPARDFGLTQGWNKVGIFMIWQGVAAVFAVITAIVSRSLLKGTGLRRAGLIPLGVLGLSLLGLAALILWAGMDRPQPEIPPPGPATELAPAAGPAVPVDQ